MLRPSTKKVVTAYSNVSIETGVLAADPHQLIVLLFDGAIKAISSAIQHMDAGNIAEKGRLITKAVTIIDGGLRASLNKKVGGDLALNLDGLYAYFAKELVLANRNDDAKKLAEIKKLMSELRGAWLQIAPVKTSQVEHIEVPIDPLAPRVVSHFSA